MRERRDREACEEEGRMSCPYCEGDATQELERATALGYRMSRCRPCRRTFNERTGTPFNHLQVPTDVALLLVLCRPQDLPPLRHPRQTVTAPGVTRHRPT